MTRYERKPPREIVEIPEGEIVQISTRAWRRREKTGAFRARPGEEWGWEVRWWLAPYGPNNYEESHGWASTWQAADCAARETVQVLLREKHPDRLRIPYGQRSAATSDEMSSSDSSGGTT